MKEIPPSSAAQTWCEQRMAQLGMQLVHLSPLRVEASHRCFYRAAAATGSFVLMTSPPLLERNDAFVCLAELFYANGIPVPHVLASDFEAGLFLMSDLGNVHFEDLYGTAAEAPALQAAIDMLARLGAVRDPLIEPYTGERLQMELEIFTEWFLHTLLARKLDLQGLQSAFDILIQAMEAQPTRCVHRDYHCRNLLFTENRLGIVDFQDALHGPILYDIASLLRDCYHVFDEGTIERWLDYFVSQTPPLQELEAALVKRWFDYTAIQRQLKAIGIFARLYLRDDKPSHLDHIVPVLQRVAALTRRYPELQHLTWQLDDCVEPAVAAIVGARSERGS